MSNKLTWQRRLQRKKSLAICLSDGILRPERTRMFRVIVAINTLTVFEAHLVANRAVWPHLNFMFTGHFAYQTKQREVLDKLSLLWASNFRRDVDTEKQELNRIVHRFINLVFLPYNLIGTMWYGYYSYIQQLEGQSGFWMWRKEVKKTAPSKGS